MILLRVRSLIASLLLTADDIAVVNSNYDQDNNKNTSDAPYQDNTVWNIFASVVGEIVVSFAIATSRLATLVKFHDAVDDSGSQFRSRISMKK